MSKTPPACRVAEAGQGRSRRSRARGAVRATLAAPNAHAARPCLASIHSCFDGLVTVVSDPLRHKSVPCRSGLLPACLHVVSCLSTSFQCEKQSQIMRPGLVMGGPNPKLGYLAPQMAQRRASYSAMEPRGGSGSPVVQQLLDMRPPIPGRAQDQAADAARDLFPGILDSSAQPMTLFDSGMSFRKSEGFAGPCRKLQCEMVTRRMPRVMPT